MFQGENVLRLRVIGIIGQNCRKADSNTAAMRTGEKAVDNDTFQWLYRVIEDIVKNKHVMVHLLNVWSQTNVFLLKSVSWSTQLSMTSSSSTLKSEIETGRKQIVVYPM